MTAVRAFLRAALMLFAALLFAQPVSAAGVKLTLINGWKNYSGTSKASVSAAYGIVHLKGAIKTSGNNPIPFVLPAQFRPAGNTFVPVDLCNATNGRLFIDTAGNVTVQSEFEFSHAACQTSLDGASFALTSDNFKPLKLKNGWQAYGNGALPPAARNINGIVHFEGVLANGNAVDAFTLPPAFRPAGVAYVKIGGIAGRNARLEIQPTGSVFVSAENDFSDVQAFSSLDGAQFALDATGFTPLTLINGWETYGGSAVPAIRVVSGTVYFEGAMHTNNNSPQPFVLPAGFRPPKTVYLPADMCAGTNGRLVIATTGEVTVEAENDFLNAMCFTSLDGISFHL